MQTGSHAELKKIIEKCRNGNSAAWHALIDVVAPVIFSICRKMNLSREESFDIFGQVSTVLVTNIGSLRSAERIVGYVATITRRQIQELFHRSRLFDKLTERALSTLTTKDEAAPDRLYESAERSRALAQAMLKLPEREHQLISALFLEGSNTSYQELANRLDMPISSIGPTRARTLEKLRHMLRRQTMPGRLSTKPSKREIKKHER